MNLDFITKFAKGGSESGLSSGWPLYELSQCVWEGPRLAIKRVVRVRLTPNNNKRKCQG